MYRLKNSTATKRITTYSPIEATAISSWLSPRSRNRSIISIGAIDARNRLVSRNGTPLSLSRSGSIPATLHSPAARIPFSRAMPWVVTPQYPYATPTAVLPVMCDLNPATDVAGVGRRNGTAAHSETATTKASARWCRGFSRFSAGGKKRQDH